MRIFTLFFVSVVLFSCKQNDNIDGINESDRFKAAVYLSAGDNYPLFNKSGTPTFFNLGRIIKPKIDCPTKYLHYMHSVHGNMV